MSIFIYVLIKVEQPDYKLKPIQMFLYFLS